MVNPNVLNNTKIVNSFKAFFCKNLWWTSQQLALGLLPTLLCDLLCLRFSEEYSERHNYTTISDNFCALRDILARIVIMLGDSESTPLPSQYSMAAMQSVVQGHQ